MANNESSRSTAATGVGSSSAPQKPTIVEILPCTRKVEIWQHYNYCLMSDGTCKAQCKMCLQFYSASSNTTLRAHFTHPHCPARKTTPEPSQPTLGRDGSAFMYNPDRCREIFAGLVISQALPFNHFDNEDFTEAFQEAMQPRYNHVSRSTLKRDAMKLWESAKQVIIDGFLNLDTRVNITTDVWSAGHSLPDSYICVTAHWIEPSSWQMMKRVITFEQFPVPHKGGRLARMLRNSFVKFNLEDKILSITLDNASNNTNAIHKLKMKYEPQMDGRFYHSRCVAHIINLVVQEGLKVAPINKVKESFKTMLRDIFKSGSNNYQRYINVCREAEKPAYSPNLDCPTRWNSTLHMFECGLKQKSTLIYFHNILAGKRECRPFPIEYWGIIERLCPLLDVFSNATRILSGVYYPTSPLVLQQIYFISNKLMEFELEGGIFATMVQPMKEKLQKYFETMPPIITCAAALNPCFNVHGVELLIEDISTNLDFVDDNLASRAKEWFTNSFEGLYNIYYTKYGNPTSHSTSGASSSRGGGGNEHTNLLNRLKERKSKKSRSDYAFSSEYERYVRENFVAHLETDDFTKFDLLGFWKAKEIMFPVLSRMALDLLSVQATSVASESAFSTSGRVLSIRRTKLTPASLEMCMCLKDFMDAQKRKQHLTSLEGPNEFEEEILTIEVQNRESQPLSDEEIALDAIDAASQGTMGSGNGSGGEEQGYEFDMSQFQNQFPE